MMETISSNLRSGMNAAFFLVISAVFIFSCKDRLPEDIIVSGDLGSPTSIIEGKKLYFGNNGTRQFLDSAVVKDGKFQFRIKVDSQFVPFRSSILYATNNPKQPYQLIGYKNPYFKRTGESNFYADRGEMSLQLDTIFKLNGKELPSFIIKNPNKQTQAAFRHLAFKNNPDQSQKKRDFNIALVKKYPYSIDLIHQLEWSKQSLSEQELSQLMPLFDHSLRNTSFFRAIDLYLKYQNKTGNDFPTDISLKKPDNSTDSIVLIKEAKYNLVVFWASWCGPCRQEIPEIKNLYAKHQGKLSITSISVDKKEDAWKSALTKENMPWKQFIAYEETSLAKLDKKYNLQSIPVWLLFDSRNNLIDKQVGYSTGNDGLRSKVEAHLAKF